MFPYDAELLAVTRAIPQSIPDVLQNLRKIDATCVAEDGLKWFNWLYLQVTEAVEERVASGGFADPAWLAQLDVQFARLYLSALASFLAGTTVPECWQVLFGDRAQASLARIQFALAGINAHINHDLPEAIVTTCQVTNASPDRGGVHYRDYAALNTTLDQLVNSSRTTLHVRLLGDNLPAVSNLENTLAAWNVSAARESAWQSAEHLWQFRALPPLASSFMDVLDGLATVIGKTLLVPVP